MKVYEVVLRRANGRLVKSVNRKSHYSAKRLAIQWDDKYDLTYQIEIVEKPINYGD